MRLAAFIFDGITTLDVIGPLQVLSRVPGLSITMVGKTAGPVTDRDIPLQLVADSSIADVTEADILLVPGGLGTRALVKDEEVLGWIRRIDAKSRWTTSVCTGSLLLAAAGVIAGRRSTTHWAAADMLNSLGAKFTTERVVEDGKYIMAAGVSSGIDMGLTLAARLADENTAKTIQLFIEYDPQPPFDSGSLAKASPEVRELAKAALAKSAAALAAAQS